MRVRLFHLPLDLPPRQAPRGPFINLMPMGLLALADRLAAEGHQVEVVHIGVETRLDPGFSVLDDVRERPVDLAGFALHWHHQIRPVGRALRQLDEHAPEVPVVVGGMTASAFAADVLRAWPGADFVITGDAEQGLAELANGLERGSPALDAVANLVHRDGSAVRMSSPRYVATTADLDALSFARFDLLRHREHYNAQFARASDGSWSHPAAFYVPTGRGCTLDCAFCSGGRTGQASLMGRTEVVFRSPARVLDDIRQAIAFGARTLCFCFDPPPHSDGYHQELFARLEPLAADLQGIFECYRPPSDALLEAFSHCFAPGRGRLSFSPTVGDEALRRRLLSGGYSNQELEQALARCRDLGLETTLYFAGVPQETDSQLEASLEWQRRLLAQFGCRIVCSPLELEPHAPWEQDPEAFGLEQARRGWDAYSTRHGDDATFGVSYAHEVGYSFPDLDARLIRSTSRLLAPHSELAVALALCGQRCHNRWLLVAPGRLDDALALLCGASDRPWSVILHDLPEAEPRWAERIARTLGPHTRAVHVAPDAVDHVRWDGDKLQSSMLGRMLTVLHLRDAAAARAFPFSLWPVPFPLPNVVLAEACRFASEPCPATGPGLLAIGKDGALRCCPSAPELGASSVDAARKLLRELAEEAAARRDCAHCSARDACSRCLFTGALSEAEFCELRRAWAAERFRPRLDSQPPGRTAGVAIGWDD